MNATEIEPAEGYTFKLFAENEPSRQLYKPREAKRPWQVKPKIVGLMLHKTPAVLPELKRLFRNYRTRNLTRAYNRTVGRITFTAGLREYPHWADLVGFSEEEKRQIRNAEKRRRRARR